MKGKGSMSGLLAHFVAAALGATVLFHLYWGAGGRFLSDAVVPVRQTARGPEKVFNPSSLAALIVAAYLSAIVALAYAVSWNTEVTLTARTLRLLLGLAGGVFLLRAVGDFHYMGFFKRVRGTRFARWDTWLFSPLILLLGLACTAIAAG